MGDSNEWAWASLALWLLVLALLPFVVTFLVAVLLAVVYLALISSFTLLVAVVVASSLHLVALLLTLRVGANFESSGHLGASGQVDLEGHACTDHQCEDCDDKLVHEIY